MEAPPGSLSPARRTPEPCACTYTTSEWGAQRIVWRHLLTGNWSMVAVVTPERVPAVLAALRAGAHPDDLV